PVVHDLRPYRNSSASIGVHRRFFFLSCPPKGAGRVSPGGNEAPPPCSRCFLGPGGGRCGLRPRFLLSSGPRPPPPPPRGPRRGASGSRSPARGAGEKDALPSRETCRSRRTHPAPLPRGGLHGGPLPGLLHRRWRPGTC